MDCGYGLKDRETAWTVGGYGLKDRETAWTVGTDLRTEMDCGYDLSMDCGGDSMDTDLRTGRQHGLWVRT